MSHVNYSISVAVDFFTTALKVCRASADTDVVIKSQEYRRPSVLRGHLRTARGAGSASGEIRRDQSFMKDIKMKNIMMWGGLMLALYALGRRLSYDRGVPAGNSGVPQPPIPPCTYTYKDFTFGLN